MEESQHKPEPDLRGPRPLSIGLSKDWLEWYRFTNGCSLREALEEGKRRLELRYQSAVKEGAYEKEPEEPEVLSTTSRLNPSPQWITWYRNKHSSTLSDALHAGRRKVEQRLKGNA